MELNRTRQVWNYVELHRPRQVWNSTELVKYGTQRIRDEMGCEREALREGSDASTARGKCKHCEREVQALRGEVKALRQGSASTARGKCQHCEREALREGSAASTARG
eukprot:824313-Pyramimonas_sp.AAC.1